MIDGRPTLGSATERTPPLGGRARIDAAYSNAELLLRIAFFLLKKPRKCSPCNAQAGTDLVSTNVQSVRDLCWREPVKSPCYDLPLTWRKPMQRLYDPAAIFPLWNIVIRRRCVARALSPVTLSLRGYLHKCEEQLSGLNLSELLSLVALCTNGRHDVEQRHQPAPLRRRTNSGLASRLAFRASG